MNREKTISKKKDTDLQWVILERAAIHVMRDAGTQTPEQMLTFRRTRVDEVLYDLSNDPYEFHNRTEDEACQDVLQDLRARTEQWQKETEAVPPARRKPNRYDYETGGQLQSWDVCVDGWKSAI